MTTILERYETHRVHKTLEQIKDLIKKARNKEGLDSTKLDNIERFEQIRIHAELVLSSVDPFLVSINTLNNLDKFLMNSKNNLSAFISNNNVNNYNTMVSNLENALQQLSLIYNINNTEDVGNLRKDITAFRKSVGQHRRNIEDSYQDYVSKLEKNYKNISTEKTTLEKELNNLKININNEKKRIDNSISQAQNQISNFQSQFSDAQEKRRENFNDFQDEIEKQADNLVDNIKEKYAGLIEDLKDKQNQFEQASEEKVQEYFNIFEKHKKDVEKVAGTIAVTGMAHGYKKIADSEKKSKIIWQVVTVLSILGLIVFGIYFVNAFKPLNMPNTDVNWASFVARFIVVSAIGTLTAYSAKQASKHLEAERYNRKMELELASIDPYLAILPDDNIYKVKEELAAKLFGQKEIFNMKKDEEDREPEITTNMLIDVLRKALSKLINN